MKYYVTNFSGYIIPKYLTQDQVMEAINGMSLTDSPEAFGLHPNAEIGVLTQTSEELFKTLLEMQPKDSGGGGGGGMSMEDKVKSILDDIMEKLPDDFNLYELHQKVKFKITPNTGS